MRLFEKRFLNLVLLMIVLAAVSRGYAKEQAQDGDIPPVKEKPPAEVPDIADIIPLSARLPGRLADLENRVSGLVDVSAIEEKYSAIEVNLEDLAGRLEKLKDLKDYKHSRLVQLREVVNVEDELFEKSNRPLRKSINRLAHLRKEWLSEKERWEQWRSSLLRKGEPRKLKSAFDNAGKTIEAALSLFPPHLDKMLAVQEKAGNIQIKIDALAAELDNLLVKERRSLFFDESGPMFSSGYLSQFSSDLWYAVRKGVHEVSWPDRRFIAGHGWVIIMNGFLWVVVVTVVYRNREKLKAAKSWRFIAERPFSAGLFLGYMTTIFIYEYEGAPATWRVGKMIVGGIAFVRLFGSLIETAWKKQLVYGLAIVMLLTRLMFVISFPLPLYRLYVVLAALTGLSFCLWRVRKSRLKGESPLYLWFLHMGSVFSAVIIISELWGKGALASYLFVSFTHSVMTVLVFGLFAHMIRGGLEWLLSISTLRRSSILRGSREATIRRMTYLINSAILGLVILPTILVFWGVYDSLDQATQSVLSLGFNLGDQRISVGLAFASVGVVYGMFLISWFLQKLMVNEVFARRRVAHGVRLSIARLVHYVVMLIGFMIVISILGVDVTKLTIVLSALGVGIGFGLQAVVGNFICGLILLFERPVRVGDMIELDGKWAEIRRIGLRSTTVKTLDEADVIVPNSDLISNQVTNWTLTNRLVRLTVPVGVAYGSDVPLVLETLAACSKGNELVAENPPPQVLFLSFGESSLDFELRIWVTDADHRLKVRSELHQEIDRRFREANIEIAFPQRDLHLRSVEESAILHRLGSNG
ncbi:MAG: mechanosensitive ion channel domain-containing protein [Planctomycetota bacterium]|jgi:small-conductance mechanosensitive channel